MWHGCGRMFGVTEPVELDPLLGAPINRIAPIILTFSFAKGKETDLRT